MISISELNNTELDNLQLFGHIGEKTRDIAELQFFFNSVEEEIKRRNLKMKYGS